MYKYIYVHTHIYIYIYIFLYIYIYIYINTQICIYTQICIDVDRVLRRISEASSRDLSRTCCAQHPVTSCSRFMCTLLSDTTYFELVLESQFSHKTVNLFHISTNIKKEMSGIDFCKTTFYTLSVRQYRRRPGCEA